MITSICAHPGSRKLSRIKNSPSEAPPLVSRVSAAVRGNPPWYQVGISFGIVVVEEEGGAADVQCDCRNNYCTR